MGERDDLLESISSIIATYRSGEIGVMDTDHVNRWAAQFSKENNIAFLREFRHVLQYTFITYDQFVDFLQSLSSNVELSGAEPKGYWEAANFLNIQKNGHSQRHMRSMMTEVLSNRFNLDMEKCGSTLGDYIYLDDILFTGGRAGTDLEAWIRTSAPQRINLQIIVMVSHTLGEFQARTRLERCAKEVGKQLSLRFWRIVSLENRLAYKESSNVLWPARVPDDLAVKVYIDAQKQFPLKLRNTGGRTGLFSSEAGRQILEHEFLVAGVKIRDGIASPKDFLRPLGCSSFGVGFGSLIATYRNCPNNCPLAIWWGDSEAQSGPLKWYPLLPRKIYGTDR